MGYNLQRMNNSRESAHTVHKNLWISPYEDKRMKAECIRLKSNPSGDPLDESKFIRDICMAEHFMTIDQIARKKIERAIATSEPIDKRLWYWIMKKVKRA